MRSYHTATSTGFLWIPGSGPLGAFARAWAPLPGAAGGAGRARRRPPVPMAAEDPGAR